MAGWVTRMSHGAVPARDEAPACQSFELSAQSRLQTRATLAPWFRCGWLVRRSLRLFGPSWRGCPERLPETAIGQKLFRRTVQGSCVFAPDPGRDCSTDALKLLA